MTSLLLAQHDGNWGTGNSAVDVQRMARTAGIHTDVLHGRLNYENMMESSHLDVNIFTLCAGYEQLCLRSQVTLDTQAPNSCCRAQMTVSCCGIQYVRYLQYAISPMQ
jgi:hypothetical protein